MLAMMSARSEMKALSLRSQDVARGQVAELNVSGGTIAGAARRGAECDAARTAQGEADYLARVEARAGKPGGRHDAAGAHRLMDGDERRGRTR